jgi:hypothetical protein
MPNIIRVAFNSAMIASIAMHLVSADDLLMPLAAVVACIFAGLLGYAVGRDP